MNTILITGKGGFLQYCNSTDHLELSRSAHRWLTWLGLVTVTKICNDNTSQFDLCPCPAQWKQWPVSLWSWHNYADSNPADCHILTTSVHSCESVADLKLRRVFDITNQPLDWVVFWTFVKLCTCTSRHTRHRCRGDTELSHILRFTAGADSEEWWPTPYTEGVAQCAICYHSLRGETMLLTQLHI